MVPATFVFLEAFPLTPNGKLDRQALPVPDGVRPELETTYMPPRTASEQILAEIWAELLGVEKVGVHDNFFELGGDSILSIQIIAKARTAGFQLTPKHLFRHQTVAELAAVVGIELTQQARQVDEAVRLPAETTSFPEAQLSQEALDNLIAELSRTME
jgi:aryl carrier-like protein